MPKREIPLCKDCRWAVQVTHPPYGQYWRCDRLLNKITPVTGRQCRVKQSCNVERSIRGPMDLLFP